MVVGLILVGTVIAIGTRPKDRLESADPPQLVYKNRHGVDTTGNILANNFAIWNFDATLAEIRDAWQDIGFRRIEQLDQEMAKAPSLVTRDGISLLLQKAALLNYEGQPKKASQVLEQTRSLVESNPDLAQEALYGVIFLQGMTALRRGENENCIMCRGESSCILPISAAARHTNPDGSLLAIRHFTEYLEKFPDDLEVQWLMNIAHMTLGEHPNGVDPRFLVPVEHFTTNEFDIGRFRDIGHIVGLNQFTQAGGAIMEDFDNDGMLDIVITTFDPTGQMNLLRNTGDGTFEDRTVAAGLIGQFGGLNCVQTDYNNDGYMDVFVIRGAWVHHPMRPTLLRNNCNGTFSDATEEAGLLDPVNSIAASWADYDNDGWLDLFICCERQPNRLYHNLGNGTFEEVCYIAGIHGHEDKCKGLAWIDYDNDGYPDLFLNYLQHFSSAALLFHNNRDGTFENVTKAMGIEGPFAGFSCWSWDFDNDGWLDIFATSYDHGLGDVVKGLIGQPHARNSNRLYHNLQGQGFQDVAKEAGLDVVLATMGSNYGDFDNDGFLDMYLGTGSPDLAMLVPNRMFKNVAGQRFADITSSSGTGNLQKGHSVACGDWDRDGSTDIFIEMGGAINGDKYHNILFQNPGHKNNWLTVKLTGDKSNRAAIGARIKVVTGGDQPQTFHRHVSSGSSFGANPLQQTIGLGMADRIATLEIQWPTSGTTQVFRDIAVNQAIAITEFAEDYQKLDWKPISIPVTK